MIIKSVFSEESEMTVDQMVGLLEKGIQKSFPNSSVVVRYDRSSIESSITIWFTLGKDKSEWSNGIAHNDPLRQVITIWGIKEGNLLPSMEVDGHGAGLIMTKNYNRIKAGWRNKKGTPEAIVKHVITYFSKLKLLAQQHKDQIVDLGNHL